MALTVLGATELFWRPAGNVVHAERNSGTREKEEAY